jgi:hypothetical protein
LCRRTIRGGGAVLVDEPEVNVYGGVVAAPVFRNIARGALRHLVVAPSSRMPPVAGRRGGTAAPPKKETTAFNGAVRRARLCRSQFAEAVEKARC